MKDTELIPEVLVIKTLGRLREHDYIWKRICEELGRTFKLTEFDYMRTSSKPLQGTYKNKARTRATESQ